MRYRSIAIRLFCGLCLWSTGVLWSAETVQASSNDVKAINVRVIKLTQTGCQFLEPEGVDHQFQTTGAADCKIINKKNAEERIKKVKPMKLKSGKYIFRVTNKNVPYPLGFWLRGAGLQRITLPGISGGGLTTGNTKDYQIILKSGKYIYSCPLNPTPDYPIIVEE